MTLPTTTATTVVNHLFGGAALSQPTSWWISLYAADPGVGVTGTTPAPLNTNRVQITAWTRSTNTASNTNAIVFDPVPTGQTWVVTNFAIFDAATGGSALQTGSFDIVKTVTAGDVYTIGATRMTITFS